MARKNSRVTVSPRRRPPVWAFLLGFAVIVGAAGVGLALVPSGQIALVPHAPIDLGNRIRVDQRRPEPLHGKLFLVGVEERKVSLLQKLYLGFDESVSFEEEPTAAIRETQQARDREAIASSKEIATAVALELLGLPVEYGGSGATVTGTAPGTPGGRLLQVGDRIVKLDNKTVVTAADVTEAVSQLPAGTTIRLGLRRDGRPAIVTLTTVPPVAGDQVSRSRIGISLSTPGLKIRPSRQVVFNTEEVVGPSAGLAFAIAVYDTISEEDVLRGRHIVATGALTLDGTVVPVGSVREKAIAAQNAGRDVLVVPADNANDAVEGVRLACREGEACTRVLPVRTVRRATELLSLDNAQLERHFAN